MELEKIIELMSEMEIRGMKRVTIKEKNGFEIELEQHSKLDSYPIAEQQVVQQNPLQTFLKEADSDEIAQKESQKCELQEKHHIHSPMVGTFYSSPTPDDDVFVKVGDTVTEDSVVCIIEAMKVMNEVKAGKNGTISNIHIENSSPVEFGTKLFEIV